MKWGKWKGEREKLISDLHHFEGNQLWWKISKVQSSSGERKREIIVLVVMVVVPVVMPGFSQTVPEKTIFCCRKPLKHIDDGVEERNEGGKKWVRQKRMKVCTSASHRKNCRCVTGTRVGCFSCCCCCCGVSSSFCFLVLKRRVAGGSGGVTKMIIIIIIIMINGAFWWWWWWWRWVLSGPNNGNDNCRLKGVHVCACVCVCVVNFTEKNCTNQPCFTAMKNFNWLIKGFTSFWGQWAIAQRTGNSSSCANSKTQNLTGFQIPYFLIATAMSISEIIITITIIRQNYYPNWWQTAEAAVSVTVSKTKPRCATVFQSYSLSSASSLSLTKRQAVSQSVSQSEQLLPAEKVEEEEEEMEVLICPDDAITLMDDGHQPPVCCLFLCPFFCACSIAHLPAELATLDFCFLMLLLLLLHHHYHYNGSIRRKGMRESEVMCAQVTVRGRRRCAQILSLFCTQPITSAREKERERERERVKKGKDINTPTGPVIGLQLHTTTMAGGDAGGQEQQQQQLLSLTTLSNWPQLSSANVLSF